MKRPAPKKAATPTKAQKKIRRREAKITLESSRTKLAKQMKAAKPAKAPKAAKAPAPAPAKVTTATKPAKAPKANAVRPAAPTKAKPVPEGRRLGIAFNRITLSKNNPRKTFHKESIAELADSILEQGLIENLVVRQRKGMEGYELVAGERRHRAIALLVERKHIPSNWLTPCLDIGYAEEGKHRAIALLENLQREDVPPLEEAQAFVELQKLDPAAYSTARIAEAIGKTQRYVQGRIAMAKNLAPEVKKALEKGQITIEQARIFAAAPIAAQKEIASDIGAPYFQADFGDVKELRAQLFAEMIPTKSAQFELSLYKGEIVEDEDTGARYFTDAKQFEKLQRDVLKKRVADYEAKKGKPGGVAWVSIFDEKNGGDYRSWEYRKAKKGESGGVAIQFTGSCTIQVHAGIVRNGTGVATSARAAGTGKPAKAAPPFTQAATMHARERKTVALQTAVIDAGAHFAMRLACLGLIVADRDGAVTIVSGVPNGLVDVLAPSVKARINECPSAAATIAKADQQPWKRGGLAPAMWAALLALSDEQVERLFIGMVARAVGTWPFRYQNRIGDDPLALAIAAKLDLDGGKVGRLLGKIEAADLDGIRKGPLLAMASQANIKGLQEGQTTKTIVAGLLKELPADFVPAHLRFGIESDIKKQVEAKTRYEPPISSPPRRAAAPTGKAPVTEAANTGAAEPSAAAPVTSFAKPKRQSRGARAKAEKAGAEIAEPSAANATGSTFRGLFVERAEPPQGDEIDLSMPEGLRRTGAQSLAGTAGDGTSESEEAA